MPEDRRILYTKMVLRESLLTLMKDQPINKISVTELCKHADLNRNTFYTHYDSPLHLLSSIEESFFEVIRGVIERSFMVGIDHGSLLEICEHIAANGDLCAILFSDHGNGDYLKRVIYILHDRSIAAWKEYAPHLPVDTLETLYSFIASGSAAIIADWVRTGMSQSPQQISEFIDQATRSVEQSFLS
ncbi:TetR/AcrR family transcriptional regulator [Paenibacillus sp. JCM 10914]|uniref:TetR/AcrR family transcriptional regulator n=1 Tax=Paenibacillus sp. JCM 10914 TaxID=1236974 RepID=UPI00130D5B10|nr:TetR-like C-terminal domain-containing protein [Paenibacillus sp. JCM 10914]